MGTVIYDGLNEKGYIAAVPRLHGEIRFEFRPPTAESLGRFIDGRKNRSTAGLFRAEAEGMALRLVSWSLLDPDGQPLPIKSATVGALNIALFNRLKDIVIYGTDGGDLDPEEDVAELLETTALAAEQGLTVAAIREDRDVKN